MGNKLNIGDKVQFLDEVGGGVILKLLKDGRYLIMDDDGFEEIYSPSQLLLPFDVEELPKPTKIVEVVKVVDSERHEFEGIQIGDTIRPIDDVGEGVVEKNFLSWRIDGYDAGQLGVCL